MLLRPSENEVLIYSIFSGVTQNSLSSFVLSLRVCDCVCTCERCGRTWFPGGDGGAWRGRPGAGAVVRQNGDVVSSAGSKSGHSGRRFQSRCPHPVCCRFPLMLPPVPDLRTRATSKRHLQTLREPRPFIDYSFHQIKHSASHS